MRFVSFNFCTRMVAVALLVASTCSAGLSHAHPDGNLAHVHRAHRLAASADATPAASDELRLVAAQAHMHVYLLGFEFTVPADDESDDDSSRGSELLVTRLVGDDFDVSLRAPAVDWGHTPDFVQLLALPIVDSCDCSSTAIALDSAPLCDSARHERTGVLRI
ncbi:MAG TPA: hypothetical protein VGJ26_08505 [Pirellulales bacterium]|jgi:hypothetical protein